MLDTSARRSLRWELVVTLAVTLVMAVVSLSLASEVLGRRRHEAAQREQLADHVQGLAALVTPQLGNGALAAAGRGQLEPVLRSNIGTLGIESITLHRLSDRQDQPPRIAVGLAPPLPPPAPLQDPGGTRIDTSDGLVIVDRALRTFGGARDSGPLVLRVVARPAPWTRTQDWTEVAVLALGVGVVMLVLGIGLIEVQVVRPLGHIRDAVGQVAMGNLEAAVPEEGPAELQSLAGSFNQMTQSLRERVEHIERQRKHLVRAEQLASVGRISAGIAHEVGNPLAAVLGYVELLLDPRSEPALDDTQRDMLERSRTQIERIQGIVTQLLHYARPTRQQPLTLRAVEAAQGLVRLLEHDPRCADVSLDVRGDEGSKVHADPGLLDQVLRNLVVNAARATAETEGPRRVTVWVEADGDRTHIDVQDSGHGVPEDVRERLFEPFFTTAKAGEGTGLGLPICQGLLESMEGSLELRPQDARAPLDGARFPGAVFRVTLPAGPPAPISE
ncbi:MAG: ATP-binding protein [Nannocystaceae bacterium]|nr:HAMP domain-containing histidine kinase [bacterium]